MDRNLSETPEPIYTYFWVAILDDGITTIVQYDLKDGHELQWSEVPVKNISCICWYPFSEELASLASKATGNLFLATSNPVLSMNIPPGSMPYIARQNDYIRFDYYVCANCGARFYWDGEGQLECPTCLSRNEWYCKVCKNVIDDPLYFSNGEVRCPQCEKTGSPQGLIRSGSLELMVGVRHEVYYKLGIEGGEIHMWNDKGEQIS